MRTVQPALNYSGGLTEVHAFFFYALMVEDTVKCVINSESVFTINTPAGIADFHKL